MAYSEHWRAGWEQEAAQLDTSGGRIAKAVDKPVQEMLAALGQDLDTTDDHGWSALMWACAKGRMESVKVLLAAGANPCAKSALVVSYNDMFFHSGMDACAIATKSGNRTEHVWETGFEESTEERAAARRVARFMFHSLNADQRLLAAYRRLLLAAARGPSGQPTGVGRDRTYYNRGMRATYDLRRGVRSLPGTRLCVARRSARAASRSCRWRLGICRERRPP